MKKYLFLISCFLLLNLALSAQNFAPIGATWHYTEQHSSSPHIAYIKMESVKDTLFQGKNCRVLEKSTILVCSDRPKTEYIYEQNDTVYFWQPDLQQFQPLIVFNANPSDWWEFIRPYGFRDDETIRVTVDSISFESYNGQSLRTMHVNYQKVAQGWTPTTYSKIVERLGDFRYLFNGMSNDNCDGNTSSGIRCYSDSVFGNYNSGFYANCEYTNIGLEEAELLKVSLFPNPVKEKLQVSWSGANDLKLSIFSPEGKIVYRGAFSEAEREIDLSGLSPGVYFVVCEGVSQSSVQKISVVAH